MSAGLFKARKLQGHSAEMVAAVVQVYLKGRHEVQAQHDLTPQQAPLAVRPALLWPICSPPLQTGPAIIGHISTPVYKCHIPNLHDICAANTGVMQLPQQSEMTNSKSAPKNSAAALAKRHPARRYNHLDNVYTRCDANHQCNIEGKDVLHTSSMVRRRQVLT